MNTSPPSTSISASRVTGRSSPAFDRTIGSPASFNASSAPWAVSHALAGPSIPGAMTLAKAVSMSRFPSARKLEGRFSVAPGVGDGVPARLSRGGVLASSLAPPAESLDAPGALELPAPTGKALISSRAARAASARSRALASGRGVGSAGIGLLYLLAAGGVLLFKKFGQAIDNLTHATDPDALARQVGIYESLPGGNLAAGYEAVEVRVE